MKWRSEKTRAHCDDATLVQLLDPQADETLVQRTAAHLDHCSQCQDRLTQLSATSEWWLDAGRWLEAEGAGASAPSFLESDEEESGVPSPETGESVTHEDAYKSLALSRLRDIGLLVPPGEDDVGSAESLGRIGRYEISHVIGFGGTGIVLRAVDRELSRVVAIKVLSPELAVSGPARKRFAREGQACAAVAHENVVAIHQVESADTVPYLVMQYIDGQSLEQYVRESRPLAADETLRLTAQIASALSAAHDQGLVHRDVKPANVLVARGGQRVWITDFGLARAVDDASLTRTGFIAGTPHYMSPEQARGESISSSSDLFGLGSVVYFMLTGRPPFRAERTLAILNRICTQAHRPVREVIAEIPDEVEAMVDRLLSKQPGDRYDSALELRDECLGMLAEQRRPNLRRKQGSPGKAKSGFAAKPGFFRRHGLWIAFGVAAPLIGFAITRSILQSRWEYQMQQRTAERAAVGLPPAGLPLSAGQAIVTLSEAPPLPLANAGSPTPRKLLQERYSTGVYPPSTAAGYQPPRPDRVAQAQAGEPLPALGPQFGPSVEIPSIGVPNLPNVQLPEDGRLEQASESEPMFGASPEELEGWLRDFETLSAGIAQLKRASRSPVSKFALPAPVADAELRRMETLERQMRALNAELK
ncbi:MAG: hypothetical protein Aurels2KO_08270 [Aureliella sp.]